MLNEKERRAHKYKYNQEESEKLPENLVENLAEKAIHPNELRVTIIGGHGEMGRCFRRMFEDFGALVYVLDIEDDLTSKAVLQRLKLADVTLLSVPMASLQAVALQVGHSLKSHSLLMDLSSLKIRETEILLKSTPENIEILGAHPLFGPYPNLKGQRIVVCPVRGRSWLPKLVYVFRQQGLTVLSLDPHKHDRLMSMVQALLHVSMFAFARTLAELDEKSETNIRPGEKSFRKSQTYKISPPIFKLMWLFTGRLLNQDKQLYSAISLDNPYSIKSLKTFSKHLSEYIDMAERKDKEKFEKQFMNLKDKFFSADDDIMQQSQNLIDFFIDEEKSRGAR